MANTVTITVTSGGVGVPTALLSVKTLLGVELNWTVTNPSGVGVFDLPDASYRVYLGPLPGYGTANPYALTVSGDTNLAISVTAGAAPTYGGLTWAQLKSMFDLQLRAYFGKDMTAFPEEVKTNFLRLAYRTIDRRLKWTRGYVDTTMVVGTAIYTLDRSIREILMVQRIPATGNQTTLERVEQDAMIEHLGLAPNNNTPLNYAAHGDSIFLYPPPAATDTLRIWGVLEAPDLTQDSDVPGFLADLHPKIPALAMGYAIEHGGSIQEGWARQEAVLAKVEEERLKAGAGRNVSNRLKTRGV